MARRVFFSFDYQRDLWRVNQIRDIPNIICCAAAGFENVSLSEEAKKDDTEIKKLINNSLDGTSVTVVCIGSMTYYRTYVTYEIEKSMERNNGILGIHINHLLDHNQSTSNRGLVPTRLAQPNQRRYQIYDYTDVSDLARWIELAAERAGRYPKGFC